jgi:hypothetical protein
VKKISVVTGVVLAAVLSVGTASRAQAQWSIAPYLGYHFDAEEVHLGAAAQFSLPARIGRARLIASPGFDYYPFLESAGGAGASMYMFNFDLLYPFETPGSVAPYVGAGLSLGHSSVSVPNPLVPGTTLELSDTDAGLNLKGGASFNKGKSVRPFGEAVLLLGNGSTVLLRGGVQIGIGQ